jgi:LPXTG-motif cell wall-anchored protein
MRRIGLVLIAATITVVMMSMAVSPTMAQDPQEEKKEAEAVQQDPKADPKVKAEEKKEAKKAEEEKKKEDLPKSGGISGTDAALLGLGAIALFIGGGLLVRRVVQ